MKLRPFESCYNELRRSATNAGRDCELTYDDFLEYTKIESCHYCRGTIPWQEYRSHRQIERGRYYLDRKHNRQGYTKSNVVVCCSSCNERKGDKFSYDEFRQVGKQIGRIRRFWGDALDE